MLNDLVEELTRKKKTISTMESCTGGALASEITNVEGASDIFKFSAVTYSNRFKIKMGVSKDVIDKYSVYSMEAACEMSYNISKFTNSNYGVGITGKFGNAYKENLYGDNYTVFISIYDKDNNKFYNDTVKAVKQNRKENKMLVIKKVNDMLLKII